MKTIKHLLLCLAFISTSIMAFGQDTFSLPLDVELETAEDYQKYETEMIQVAEWLVQTDLNEHKNQRIVANSFVMKWIGGSPNVSVSISSGLMNHFDKNTDLLIVYLANYSSSILQGNEDEFAAKKAGLLAVLKVYNKGIDIKKNKALKNLYKADKGGELDDYIRENI